MTITSRVKLSPNGPKLSSFIQGYWRMAQWQRSVKEHAKFVHQHIELGVTTVDHAHVYGTPSCEEMFGDVLKISPNLRDQIQIVTKCGIEVLPEGHGSGMVNHYNSSAKNIIASADLSLLRMGVDSIDVFLIHRPDFLMDCEEVAAAILTLQKSGKVKHFGVSNFSPSQFSMLQSFTKEDLVTNQVEINPFNMTALEDGTLDQLQSQHIRPMAWSCLAGGKLEATDSAYSRYLNNVLMDVAEEVAAESVEQVLFAWVLRLPSQPIPIIGSGNIERIRTAVNAQNISLTHEQWYRIWVAAKGHGVP